MTLSSPSCRRPAAPGTARVPGALAGDSAAMLRHVWTAEDPLIGEMLRQFQAEVAPDPAGSPADGVRQIRTDGIVPLDAVVAVGGAFSSIAHAVALQ